MLLGEDGLDPFLEDLRTLWLIHWNGIVNLSLTTHNSPRKVERIAHGQEASLPEVGGKALDKTESL
jgi:hypothetical protein